MKAVSQLDSKTLNHNVCRLACFLASAAAHLHRVAVKKWRAPPFKPAAAKLRLRHTRIFQDQSEIHRAA
jgi:hypothetical protein